MKKLLPLIFVLLLILTSAHAEYVTRITPQPTTLPTLTLRPSDDEVKAYASPNMKSNIVGYIIVGGRQEVQVQAVQGEWVRVRFTSIYGMTDGWIPLSCFEAAATPAPTPTPTPTPPQSSSAFVTNPQSGYRLNLRAAPSASSASLGKYYTGTPLMLTDESRNGFLRVQIGSVTGWVDARYITTDPYSFYSELKQVRIDNPGGGANLRAGAGASTAKLGWYPHGSSVTILGVREDNWYHVVAGGQAGYMSASLLSQTYPWQFGTDSDNPAVSGVNLASGSTAYLNSAAGSALRAYASASARVLGTFYAGCPVTIVSYTRTGWVYVRIADLEGYVDASSLSSTPPNRTGLTRTIVNPYGTGLNLRTLPTMDSTVKLLCRNYSTVTVLGDLADDWCYVLVGGQYGYMMGSHLVAR